MSSGTLGGMISHITLEGAIQFLILLLLVIGGTLRLTRLVTTDSLSDWLLRDRAQRWADRIELAQRVKIQAAWDEHQDNPGRMSMGAALALEQLHIEASAKDPMTWQARMVTGLYCPFCVGFWIGVAIFVATFIAVLVAPLAPVVLGVWVSFLALLTLNYITGHISARIDH